MEIKKVTFIIAIIFLSGTFFLINAQSGVSPSGGDGVSSMGSISFTVGQTFYASYENSGYNIIEGKQQPFLMVEETNNILNNEPNISILAYPNPAQDYVFIKTNVRDYTELIFCLTNINGCVLKTGELKNSQTYISLEEYGSGVYFIEISTKKENNNTKFIQLFDIYKTN